MSYLQLVWDHPLTRIVVFVAAWVLLFVAFLYSASFAFPKMVQHPLVFSTLSCGMEAAAAIAALLILNHLFEHRPVSDYGFRVRGVVTETIAGYLIGFSVISLVVSILAAAGFYEIMGRDHAFRVWLPLLLYLFVAIAEETAFRGFIFNTMERRYGTSIGVMATCLMFGLAHLINPMPHLSVLYDVGAVLFIGVEAGILFCGAFLVKRTIWLPIGIHWAWNFCEGPFLGTNVSGTADRPSYFLAKTSGPFFLTGGTFGPEASVICLIVATIAGLALLRIAVRNKQWRPFPLEVKSNPI